MHLLNSDTAVDTDSSYQSFPKPACRFELGNTKYNEPEQLCFDFESDGELPLTKHIENKENLSEGMGNIRA